MKSCRRENSVDAKTVVDFWMLAGEERWHRTRAEALVGHERLAEWCRIGNAHNHGLSEDQLV